MSRKSENPDHPAISFKADVSRLPESGITVRMDATSEELEALALRHGVEEVTSFHAEIKLTRWKMDGVRARGYVDADIVQRCVVTLEPLEMRVREEIDMIFLPEGADLVRNAPGEGQELIVDFDGEDVPETFSGNKIDLGGVAEEIFDLGIDPYPRKAGAEIAANSDVAREADTGNSPFAALSKLGLKGKQQKN